MKVVDQRKYPLRGRTDVDGALDAEARRLGGGEDQHDGNGDREHDGDDGNDFKHGSSLLGINNARQCENGIKVRKPRFCSHGPPHIINPR